MVTICNFEFCYKRRAIRSRPLRQQSGLLTLTKRKTINFITIIPYFLLYADSAVFIIMLLQFFFFYNTLKVYSLQFSVDKIKKTVTGNTSSQHTNKMPQSLHLLEHLLFETRHTLPQPLPSSFAASELGEGPAMTTDYSCT